MGDALALVLAAAFAAMGVGAFVRPMLVVEQFGGSAPTAAARSEIRAVYGGFGLAMAGVLLATVRAGSPGFRDGVLVAVAVALGGMAVGRLAGIVVERGPRHRATELYLLVEIVGAALLLLAAWR